MVQLHIFWNVSTVIPVTFVRIDVRAMVRREKHRVVGVPPRMGCCTGDLRETTNVMS